MFVESKVACQGSVTTCGWSTRTNSLVLGTRDAKVGVNHGSVSLHSDDGEVVEAGIFRRPSLARVVSAHPTLRLIAVGWESGEVLVWNDATQTAHENAALHVSSIRSLTWSTSGDALVSTDADGRVGVWKPNKTGRLSLVYDMKRQAAMTHCAFNPTLDVTARSSEISFFLAASDGAVYTVVGQSCEPVAYLPAAPHTFMFSPDGETLVAITETMMLSIYDVEGAIARVRSEVKLSGRSPQAFVWLSNSVLAGATNDGIVRLWDLEHDDNASLALTRMTGEAVSGVSVCALAYDPVNALLAAGEDSICLAVDLLFIDFGWVTRGESVVGYNMNVFDGMSARAE
jgi:intraflagellar transport protein 140